MLSQKKSVSLLLLLCFALTFFTTSCASEEETLWLEMMDVHDEVMPKMSELTRLQKNLKEVSNSEETIAELVAAEEAMWDWMHNLKRREAIEQMDDTAAVNYIKKAKASIETVGEQMVNSIEKGNKLLLSNK